VSLNARFLGGVLVVGLLAGGFLLLNLCDAGKPAPITPASGTGATVERAAPDRAATSRSVALAPSRTLAELKLIAELAGLLEQRPDDFAWVESRDVPALTGLFQAHGPTLRQASADFDRVASEPHQKRVAAGKVEVHPVVKGELSAIDRLRRPEHPGQVVIVDMVQDPATQKASWRVSRFEPGEEPAVDAANARLVEVRARLTAEIAKLRGGR
jgi:hypothetical protein